MGNRQNERLSHSREVKSSQRMEWWDCNAPQSSQDKAAVPTPSRVWNSSNAWYSIKLRVCFFFFFKIRLPTDDIMPAQTTSDKSCLRTAARRAARLCIRRRILRASLAVQPPRGSGANTGMARCLPSMSEKRVAEATPSANACRRTDS